MRPTSIQMDYRYIVEYADARRHRSRSTTSSARRLKLDDFDQDQIEGGKVDGKLYGISLGANSVAMMVNTDRLRGGRRRPCPTCDWSLRRRARRWPRLQRQVATA